MNCFYGNLLDPFTLCRKDFTNPLAFWDGSPQLLNLHCDISTQSDCTD